MFADDFNGHRSALWKIFDRRWITAGAMSFPTARFCRTPRGKKRYLRKMNVSQERLVTEGNAKARALDDLVNND